MDSLLTHDKTLLKYLHRSLTFNARQDLHHGLTFNARQNLTKISIIGITFNAKQTLLK